MLFNCGLDFFRDGVPYCEKDYQLEFGVTCAGCGGFITGKVLQVNTSNIAVIFSLCFQNPLFYAGLRGQYYQKSFQVPQILSLHRGIFK